MRSSSAANNSFIAMVVSVGGLGLCSGNRELLLPRSGVTAHAKVGRAHTLVDLTNAFLRDGFVTTSKSLPYGLNHHSLQDHGPWLHTAWTHVPIVTWRCGAGGHVFWHIENCSRGPKISYRKLCKWQWCGNIHRQCTGPHHTWARIGPKITVFLHISCNYLHAYMPFIITKIWTSQNCFAWKMEKCQYYPECQGFYTFFSFHALQNVGKVHFAS